MRALLVLALLLAPHAFACDPAEMDQAMSEICDAATQGALEAVEAATPLARAEERAAMNGRLAQIRHACAHGDPAVAAQDASRLARFAGRIEARADQPRPVSL